MVHATQKAIFISYRRADADAMAGRIKDRLERDLPGRAVFMDVDSIGAGADFRRVIEDALARSEVLLALIGPRWDSERLGHPDDLVRHEIATALARELRVVPVLINDASMPAGATLPADVLPLIGRNALVLRHSRFDDDFASLVTAIGGTVRRPGRARGIASLAGRAVLGAVLGTAAAFAGLMLDYHLTGASASDRIGATGATLLIPVCALIGAGIMLWRASLKA